MQIYQLAENPRTRARAAIKRASALARQNMNQLDDWLCKIDT